MDLHAVVTGVLGDFRCYPEALNQVENLGLGQRFGQAELLAGQAHGDGRRRLGMRVDRHLRLAAGMADLHPDAAAWTLARLCHGAKARERRGVLRPSMITLPGRSRWSPSIWTLPVMSRPEPPSAHSP